MRLPSFVYICIISLSFASAREFLLCQRAAQERARFIFIFPSWESPTLSFSVCIAWLGIKNHHREIGRVLKGIRLLATTRQQQVERKSTASFFFLSRLLEESRVRAGVDVKILLLLLTAAAVDGSAWRIPLYIYMTFQEWLSFDVNGLVPQDWYVTCAFINQHFRIQMCLNIHVNGNWPICELERCRERRKLEVFLTSCASVSQITKMMILSTFLYFSFSSLVFDSTSPFVWKKHYTPHAIGCEVIEKVILYSFLQKISITSSWILNNTDWINL